MNMVNSLIQNLKGNSLELADPIYDVNVSCYSWNYGCGEEASS